MTSKYDFVGHTVYDADDAKRPKDSPVNNVILRPENPELKWIELTTERLGHWRAKFRSAYIGWSVTINGLFIAHDKYSSEDWKKNHKFKVSSIRGEDGYAAIKPIALWESSKVADAHMRPIKMLCCYCVIDFYAVLEEFVFDFYQIYLRHHPEEIIRGPEYRDLRAMYAARETEPELWESAFEKRLNEWRRKRLYDGLGKVFRAYILKAQLQSPSWHKATTVDSWGECIDALSELRNCLVHGSEYPSELLYEFSKKPHSMGFNFEKDKAIDLEVGHLMNIECFFDSLLSAINGAFVEKVHGAYNGK